MNTLEEEQVRPTTNVSPAPVQDPGFPPVQAGPIHVFRKGQRMTIGGNHFVVHEVTRKDVILRRPPNERG